MGRRCLARKRGSWRREGRGRRAVYRIVCLPLLYYCSCTVLTTVDLWVSCCNVQPLLSLTSQSSPVQSSAVQYT
ncbi:hypothetical protein BCV70DRAFT_38158 [Testicularia cyperi]|uniref:Uncharacterized protein n=1 Tax=Testicularia cyperi TaxID=1882483 RepID=A0A317XM26_9BASI|nr:hypothetical protein BCV70DRAFT_38158 [Testicularia cyperi]